MYQIAAEPYTFTYEKEKTALIVIDMQKDFLDPQGFCGLLGNDVSQLVSTIEPVKRLIEIFRKEHLMVIHTREGYDPSLCNLYPSVSERSRDGMSVGDKGPLGRFLIRGEAGHDIIEELYPIDGEKIIDKPGKGAFHATELEAILRARGITFLVICGVTTEVCVHTTLREANDRGFKCIVPSDAVGSYFPAFQEAGLKMISAQGGIFGWVSTADAVIESILE